MSKKIFCYDCCHFDSLHHCKFREIFVKPNRNRFCQDFVDKTKILKPKEEIPQPVKTEEKVPEEVLVAPIQSKLELTTEQPKPIEKKLLWWKRIIVWFKKLLKRSAK